MIKYIINTKRKTDVSVAEFGETGYIEATFNEPELLKATNHSGQMSYFYDAYKNISLPMSAGKQPGLRRAQLGAVHAISSYFTLPQKEPAIVVLPTGGGKTAVIFLAAFMLRSKRALIVTPSQLVRSQIAENARTLDVLKRLEVLPLIYDCPRVAEVKSRLATDADWQALKDFDFVVATPNCVSPGIDGVAAPPEDMFDLILMDEAHHSEAPRWSDILKHFEHTKRLLFTATPFRRDKREVRGKFIYNFPLREAHKDKIFGNIRFVPVDPPTGTNHDSAIAKQTEAIYRKDTKDGWNHRIMVRTDSKNRAHDLAKLYEQETKLRLAVVHSGLTFKSTEKTLAKLNTGELDGIICVAMLGEGFDFPQLKIAAIHSPHKSLAVTLQFIGRFARTSTDKIGEAKFLAVPQDIRAETDELYKESAAWQEIVANLSSARVEQEANIKEIAASFVQSGFADLDVADVVMSDFRPFFHVKIYKVTSAPNLAVAPNFAEGVTILRTEVSVEHNTAMFLLRQTTRPRWTNLDQFARIEYDFVVTFYDAVSGFLFINSTRRTLEFYKLLEEHYGGGTATLLPGPRISRVLADLKNTEFFSVGLKNGVQNSNTESYLIKSGPSAQKGISPTDALRYQRGHVMGKGTTSDGTDVTIGYSSSSKVWSNYAARVGELITWCQTLAKKLATSGKVITGTELDTLDVGEEVAKLPPGVIGVGWPDKVYKEFPRARISTSPNESPLLDFELSLVAPSHDAAAWEVLLNHVDLISPLRLRFFVSAGNHQFEWTDSSSAGIVVIRDEEEIPLTEYLRHYPLSFFLEDFSRIEGVTYYKNGAGNGISLTPNQLVPLDWKAEGINIECEINPDGLNLAKPMSIQDYLGTHLLASNAKIVFFDHGTGEMADFIAFTELASGALRVSLYHCKSSGGPEPGDRVADAYEVCGQVVKCLLWLKNKQRIRAQILQRDQDAKLDSQFIKGSRIDLQNILSDDVAKKLEFEICVVQPGIPATGITEKISHVLGAASNYVARASSGDFKLLCSP